MTLKALIFDVDGTLAETEKNGHRISFNQAFEKNNLPWRWDVDTYGDLLEIGGGKERLIHYFLHYQPNFITPEPLTQFISRLYQEKNYYYQQLLINNAIPLRIGIKRLIMEAFQKKITLAIASTSSEENIKVLLDVTLGKEISKYFSVIVAGDMVKNKKPAPDIYLLALKKLNIFPENCLAIEDTNQGLIAASNANIKTVITTNDYTKNQNFDQAILGLNSLGEPNLPFSIIKGNSYNHSYFNIDLAKKLLL